MPNQLKTGERKNGRKTNTNSKESNIRRRKGVLERQQAENRPEKADKRLVKSRSMVRNGAMHVQRKASGKNKRAYSRRRYACPALLHKRRASKQLKLSSGGCGRMKCPDCGSTDITLDYEKGENFCNGCGLIIEDLLPEKHEILPEGRTAHSPGTIKAGGFMPDGAIVKASWMLSSKEKNVIKARKSIRFIAGKLNLPRYIVNDAFRLYKDAIYRDLSVGRDNASLKYACLYAACKMCEMPKTPKEVLEYATKTEEKDLLKSYKLIKEKLGLSIKQVDPVDYAHRYAAQLDISPKTITKIIELVEKIKKTNLFTGRHPESVIAAAIYLGCKLNKEHKTQREISAVVGVIEITIRKHYKEIEDKLGLNN